MKKYGIKNLILVLFILNSFYVQSQESDLIKLYVGTFTNEGAAGIYLCDFHPELGEIMLRKVFKGIDNPSFLKISPDKKFLYAVSRSPQHVEESGGYVTAFQLRNNGDLIFLNKQLSNGAGPCHVDVSPDGKYVAIATYNGGTTSLFPVHESGKLFPATTVIKNIGSSVHTQRQTAPHAHSIKFHPETNQVFSADLGTDKLNILYLEQDRLVTNKQEYVSMEPGAGPRHFDFLTKGNVIYVINELNSTVSVLKNESSTWRVFQTVSTLSPSFSGENFCADIHVSPNGRFLYGSNRGDNSIAVFAIENYSKRLIFMGTVSTHGNWPRNFTISPDGRYMLVANQKSGNITVFKIDAETGVPEFTGNQINIPSPVCLEFL